MPADSRLLRDILGAAENEYFIPPWAPRTDRRVWRLPIDIFYPLHFQQTSLLAQAGLRIADIVIPRSLGLHLYSHSLKGLQPAAGSPLHEVMQS